MIALAAASSGAQFTIAPPTPPPLPLAEDTALALGDAQDRMTVPVTIGERGPWNFIIDTGAERTVVSRELAGVLGLPAGPTVRVTAMTGTSIVETVVVRALGVSTISHPTIEAPALASRHLGAPGMLGVDALQGHAVSIDFDRNRMTLKPSRRRVTAARTGGDEVVVTARSFYGQLIVTDARCNGARIAVIVDTGSPVSIGNPSLLAALRKARPIGTISVTTATGGELSAPSYLVDGVTVGGVGFDNVPIAIADGAPFRRFGLEKRPALLLGMDTLRLFRNVQIDFANRQIRFTLPRRAQLAGPAIAGL